MHVCVCVYLVCWEKTCLIQPLLEGLHFPIPLLSKHLRHNSREGVTSPTSSTAVRAWPLLPVQPAGSQPIAAQPYRKHSPDDTRHHRCDAAVFSSRVIGLMRQVVSGIYHVKKNYNSQ